MTKRQVCHTHGSNNKFISRSAEMANSSNSLPLTWQRVRIAKQYSIRRAVVCVNAPRLQFQHWISCGYHRRRRRRRLCHMNGWKFHAIFLTNGTQMFKFCMVENSMLSAVSNNARLCVRTRLECRSLNCHFLSSFPSLDRANRNCEDERSWIRRVFLEFEQKHEATGHCWFRLTFYRR